MPGLGLLVQQLFDRQLGFSPHSWHAVGVYVHCDRDAGMTQTFNHHLGFYPGSKSQDRVGVPKSVECQMGKPCALISLGNSLLTRSGSIGDPSNCVNTKPVFSHNSP